MVSILKRIVKKTLSFGVISIGIYLILFRMAPRTSIYHNESLKNENPRNQACVHPKLQLWHPDIKGMFRGLSNTPLACADDGNWVHADNGTFKISVQATKKHGHIDCDYTPYFRNGDDWAIITGNVTKNKRDGSLLESDFFSVSCKAKDKKTYSNIQAGIAISKSVHNRHKENPMPKNAMGVNVLMIGLDSMSRMTWMRTLPKAHDYFVKELGGVILEGYNIVGDGTPQALLPILTGKTEPELPEARRGFKGAKPVNGHPWIWKDLQKAGYATQYNEDSTDIGAFTYRMLGFKEQPVDHYMRTFYRLAEKQYRRHKGLCLGSLPRHTVMWNYVLDFFDMYNGKPKFSFSFNSELAHDNLRVFKAENDLIAFLKSLKKGNYLNSTIIILMGDHGARFQKLRQFVQGKYEERNPYIGWLLPSWFKEKYPEAYKNLHINAERLTTPFDIHATFMHMLNYTGSKLGDRADREISLFDEVPLDRTCKDADIENHWCSCLNWKTVSPTDAKVKISASAFLKKLNNITSIERSSCEELKIKMIKSATRFVPKDDLIKFKRTNDGHGRVADLSGELKITQEFYQITLITSPGDGMFEATVRTERNSTYIDELDISRINKYGNQPHCVSERLPHLRKYCYCKEQLPNR